MAKQAETRFKELVLKNLRALPNVWVAKIQQLAKRGTPDLLCCIDGVFVAIELKRDGTCAPDPLQEWNLNSICESGGVAIVCYPENWEATFAFLKKMAGQEKSGKGIKWIN